MYHKMEEKVMGIYNLAQFCNDMAINQHDFIKEVGTSMTTFRLYLNGKEIMASTARKINDYIEGIIDNPEDYLLRNCPYTPSKGRKPGSKNKNSRVKIIPVEEYKSSKEESVFEYKSRPSTKHYVEGEEIFTALRDGETVYQEGCQDKFTMLKEDGFSVIVKSRGDKMLFFNSAMDLERTYYTLHREPLHLEIGKCYANKQGQKVTIFAGEDGTFKGIITGEPQVYSYNLKGEFLDTAANANSKDLVEELA